MSGLIDAIGQVFGWDMAMIVTAMALQLKYLQRYLSAIEERVMRLEDQFIVTDGGTEEDE